LKHLRRSSPVKELWIEGHQSGKEDVHRSAGDGWGVDGVTFWLGGDKTGVDGELDGQGVAITAILRSPNGKLDGRLEGCSDSKDKGALGTLELHLLGAPDTLRALGIKEEEGALDGACI